MSGVLKVFDRSHKGEGGQYPQKLEIGLLGLKLVHAVENSIWDMLYIIVGCCV